MHNYIIEERGRPKERASKAMIALHGRGGKSSDILSFAPFICDDSFYIVAPQATENRWYPYNFMEEESKNEPWLTSAIDIVKRLIDETSEYFPLKDIYLMGFSQGACLALEVSARYATKYGGIIAFSGGLIGHTLNESNYHGNLQNTKVFMGVSDIDSHIPLSRVKESHDIMKNLGGDVTLKVYKGMGHIINHDEINWVIAHITMKQ